MKIVCTEAEYIALLDRFKTAVTVIEKGDERIYRGVNTLGGIPVEVEDGNTVRVVRCKDCKHFKKMREIDGVSWTGFCKYGEFHTDEDDFCSRGERKRHE